MRLSSLFQVLQLYSPPHMPTTQHLESMPTSHLVKGYRIRPCGKHQDRDCVPFLDNLPDAQASRPELLKYQTGICNGHSLAVIRTRPLQQARDMSSAPRKHNIQH